MKVCVVVPVYNNRKLVELCLASIVAGGLPDALNLVVVDDGSTEEGLSDWLRLYLAKVGGTLIRHHENQGYSSSVNTALQSCPAQDIILLNSDTVVHGDWWLRLYLAGVSAPDVGTVTPLSNNGDICSYPLPSSWSKPPGGFLSDLCANVNGDATVELPTGVGFCLFLKRACVNDTGLFDTSGFPRGYGEENDFCLRASARGWRHVCHTGVYVEHVGGASFGDERFRLMRDADAVLSERYPDYQAKVEAFLETDPLAEYRDALSLARLKDTQQQAAVISEFAAERKAQLSRYYDLLRTHREETSALNQGAADFAEIVAELRKSNSDLAQDYQSLEKTYRTLETAYGALEENHISLSEELDRVRMSFRQADDQLHDYLHRTEELQNENAVLNQQLEVAVNERDYFESKAQRRAALWPIRAGRSLKRLFRR